MDVFEKRRRELGLTTPTSSAASSTDDVFQQRRQELGLIPGQASVDSSQDKRAANEQANPWESQLPMQQALTTPGGLSGLLQKRGEELKSSSPTLEEEDKPLWKKAWELLVTKGPDPDSKLGKIDKQVGAFTDSAVNAATFGAFNQGQRMLANVGSTDAQDRLDAQEGGAGVAGTVAGSLLPGGLAWKGASAVTKPLFSSLPKVADNLVSPLASKLSPQLGALTRVGAQNAGKGAALATRGAAAGAAFQIPQEIGEEVFNSNDQTIGQRFRDVGTSAALGAVLDPAIDETIDVLSRPVRSLLERIAGRSKQPEVVQEILALPEPKQRGNVNRAETPEVIVADGTVEPLGLPEPNVAPPTTARIAKQINPMREKVESFAKRMEGAQLTPGREYEEFLEAWGRYADETDPDLETAIEMAYKPRPNRVAPDLVDRAKETQRKREVYGVGLPVKSKADRYQGFVGEAPLPKTQVRRIGEPLIPRSSDVTPQNLPPFESPFAAAAVENISPAKNPEPIKLSTSEVRRREDAEQFRTGDGDASTLSQKISRGTTSKKRVSFKEMVDKVRTAFVDDLAALERLESNVKGSVSSAEDSLYKTARLYRGAPAKANEVVRTRLTPVIESVEKQGYNVNDLEDYALAVHARDVNDRGIKSGFTDKEIADTIQRFKDTPLEQARQELVRISDDLLEELVEGGVISKELREGLREKWPNYMPLFRSFDDEKVEFTNGLSKAMANVASPLKKLEGSERDVIRPLESMVKNIFQTVNSAERNKVARQLARLADEDLGTDFVQQLEPGEEVGRKNVVSVLDGGKKIQYEVQPEVYKALLNLDRESSNTLIELLSKPAQLLRAGATLTPEFSLRNPIRDVVQAYVVSNSGFNPLVDFPIGLYHAITKGKGIRIGDKQITKPSQLYTQWLKDNGGFGNIISMDRDVHREALEKVLKEPISKKFVNVVTGKSLMNLLRAITDASEAATKLGEYRAALRKGVSNEEAAYRSRDIMDFSRGGNSVRSANRVVAFLNANIQGKSKIIRAIQQDPVGFTVRATTAVTMPTVGVFLAQKYMANEKQKELIDNAPDWLRNTFWLIPVPGTDQVARVPKPFDIAPLFANLPERVLNYLFDNDKYAFDNFAKDTLKDMSIPFMITGLEPFYEAATNYSFFREAPIVPQREEGLKPRDQYDINTTSTARVIGRGIEQVAGENSNMASPRIIDNTIRGLTAGLGTYATSFVDMILEGLNVVDKPEKPSKDISQAPLTRAFLVNQNQTTKALDTIYNERERLTEELGSAKLNKTEFTELGRLRFLDKSTERIGKVSKNIRGIENNEDMSGDEKARRIRELTELRNRIAVDALDRLRKARENAK